MLVIRSCGLKDKELFTAYLNSLREVFGNWGEKSFAESQGCLIVARKNTDISICAGT
jgi:hypothetical protein